MDSLAPLSGAMNRHPKQGVLSNSSTYYRLYILYVPVPVPFRSSGYVFQFTITDITETTGRQRESNGNGSAFHARQLGARGFRHFVQLRAPQAEWAPQGRNLLDTNSEKKKNRIPHMVFKGNS